MIKKIIKETFKRLGFEITKSYQGVKYWPKQQQLPQTNYETDQAFHARYDKAQERTQMEDSDNPLRRMRHYTLMQLFNNADIDGGDICELGCFRGLSAWQISSQIQERNSKAIFHIFDSFQGLSEIEKIDTLEVRPQNATILRKQFACSLEQVRENLREYDFIKYYKGWIPDRFSEVEDRLFSFVHIDVDLYQPIYDSISFFFPRLIMNGIMVFDDYGCLQFPGAKKAVDDYLRSKDVFFVRLPSGQAFLIK